MILTNSLKGNSLANSIFNQLIIPILKFNILIYKKVTFYKFPETRHTKFVYNLDDFGIFGQLFYIV